MKIHELLENILKDSRSLGTYPLSELLSFAEKRMITGIAVAKENGSERYVALLAGEPEGAVYIDEKGVLFGDKAVLMVSGRESFVLTEIKEDIVEALIMSCRIFDKSRLRKSITPAVPEVGKIGGGIGVLTISVLRDGKAANGIRVSIRKDGRIVGSDITTDHGEVGFRVAFGDYDCILQDRTQAVTKYRIHFDGAHTSEALSL